MPNREPLSPEDDQEREVYARYGSAMYYGQALEAEIKGALVLANMRDATIATRDDFDEMWTQNFKATMGKLLERFKPYLSGDGELNEDLQLALKLRNQLAHHFFWDHAEDILTTAGRQRMIDECMAAAALLDEARGRIWAASLRFADAMAIVIEPWDESFAVSKAKKVAVSSSDGRPCGRCGIPMVFVGTGRRPYWECSDDHTVTLT